MIFLSHDRLLPLPSLGKRWWGPLVCLLHDLLKGLESVRLALYIAYRNARLLPDSGIVTAIRYMRLLYPASCVADATLARCGCHLECPLRLVSGRGNQTDTRDAFGPAWITFLLLPFMATLCLRQSVKQYLTQFSNVRGAHTCPKKGDKGESDGTDIAY